MPKQTHSQKTGSLGQSIVETQIRSSKFWIARNLNEDFGIDIELEFAPDQVKGKFVKAQIKSHGTATHTNGFIVEYLSKSFLRYCFECRVPIILIVVSTDTSESWYLWVQQWLLNSKNISNIYDETQTKNLGVQIPLHNDFISGLNYGIIAIATWENSTQLYIAVRDLTKLSLQLYDNKLSRLLFGYLDDLKSGSETSVSYFDSLIERVIVLGVGVWATEEGYKVTQMLFEFIKKHGEQINANHVSKLILRGNECSRTGINALGLLYEYYPEHTVSLKLPQRFKDFSDQRLHYYCTIRERYLDFVDKWWLNECNNITIGNLRADFSSIQTSVLDKWANRGDSVIFDYLFLIED